MPAADLPLQDLALRLAEKQAELEQARQAYDARLASLARQREELQAQLRAVDAEIQAVNAIVVPSVAPAPERKQRGTTKATRGANKKGANGKAASQATAVTKPAAKRGEASLRAVLMRLLAKSKRPLKARELADQALAAGYESASKDFVSVVWVALGKLDDVENVPGQGYRLKHAAKAK